MAVCSTAIDSILTIPSLPTSDQVTTDDLQVMLSFTETSNLCEWINIPEEGTICGMRFETLDSFLTHIRSHISLLSKPGVCQWNLCRYSCTHPIEFTSHVLFHGHHSNLKCKGEEFSDFKCLPACQLGSELVNDVPKVEEGWKCLWEESDECCGKVFDCVNIYYDHVKEHVEKMEKSKCGWKGKCPYHVLQNYHKIFLWPTGPSLKLLSTVFNVYIYIYILVSLTPVCVVYIVKEVASFREAWSINVHARAIDKQEGL